MLISNKESVLEGLEALQKTVCAYGSEYRCDCKYGIREDARPLEISENTGCPELRVVILILSNMTDTEYAALTIEP